MSKGRENRAKGRPDDFQTPAWALDPLWQYLWSGWRIWEPACGKGNLVRAFDERGFATIGTDITHGQDFLTCEPPEFEVLITNPPFSIKDAWLARCYEMEKPFALLMPFTAMETPKRLGLFRTHGVEVIILPRRVNFETPSGSTSGRAWFPVGWFTWGLHIGQGLTFWEEPAAQKVEAPAVVDLRQLTIFEV